MKSKLIRIFIHIAGALLLLTATAKLISGAGSARILQNHDPILGIAFRYVFWIIGFLELFIAFFCFISKKISLQLGLIAWLSTSFLLYRLGLTLVGYHRPCGCLGNLTDALRIPPETADMAMKIILGYLLIGSYAGLFWLWRQHRNEGGMKN